MKNPLAGFYSLVLALALLFLPLSMAAAQTADDEDEELEDEELEDEDVEEGEVIGDEELADEDEDEDMGLEEPSLLDEEEGDAGMMGGTKLAPPSFFGTPGETGDMEDEGLDEGKEDKKDKVLTKKDEEKVLTEPQWFEKTTKFFEITGYFRLRSDLFFRLDMGFPSDNPNAPFARPANTWPNTGSVERVEANYTSKVPCGEEGSHHSWCGKQLLTGANLRLRIEPVISLSEMVKIKAQFDVLDNLVLGSTPEGYYSQPGEDGGMQTLPGLDPWVPVLGFTSTQVPPTWSNSISSPISVRTVWGEVLLKNIGMIKFGRMPSHWGLGVLANDGSCLDCDYGDIADRVMFATKLFGTVLAAGWDFPASGPTSQKFYNLQGQAYDISVADDVYQWMGVVAYKLEKEEEERKLAAGKPVLAGGAYYLYRQQKLSALENVAPGADDSDINFVYRGASAHIGDLWLKFLMGDFRAELEWVLIGGKIDNIQPLSYTGEDIKIFQFGGALQLEHTFLDDRLLVQFEMGYASGDQNVEGLTPSQGLLSQGPGSGSTLMSRAGWATAFRFDPDYNVDLILFEELLGQVSASYYFKPSVAYWFVKDHFYGQLDIVYSRASEFISTNGNNGNLGVEFDVSLKYKTKDRFTGILQYAYLIPLAAWKDLSVASPRYRDLKHPMTLQAMLAIEY